MAGGEAQDLGVGGDGEGGLGVVVCEGVGVGGAAQAGVDEDGPAGGPVALGAVFGGDEGEGFGNLFEVASPAGVDDDDAGEAGGGEVGGDVVGGKGVAGGAGVLGGGGGREGRT